MSLLFRVTSCLLLLSFGRLQAEEEEIRVELSLKKTLTPLYLSEFAGDKSPLKPSYLEALRKTLRFDLQHSGYCTVSELIDTHEKILSGERFELAFHNLKWEGQGVDIVLKAEAIENRLDLYAYNVFENKLRKFEGIPLTGDLAHDRGQIHKLSSALLKALFSIEGIAHTHLLYSVQKGALHTTEAGWKAEIWQCDYDGENAKQVTFEDDYSITPVFIPPHPLHGSDRYLYVNYKNGQPKIYYSSLSAKTGKPLLPLRGNQLLPAISLSRDKMAFISDATGRADLFLQEFNDLGQPIGKPTQLFSYPRSTQASPTFSPDGSQIAFVSDKDGTPRIYLIPTKVENNKRPIPLLLTKKNRENTCPSWSPDGTKIAYSAKTSGVRQIWVYDLKASEEIQLTTGPGNKENPVWGPDSLHLVFNSTDPDHSELYLVNLNQPEAVKITNGPGKKHYPTWGKR